MKIFITCLLLTFALEHVSLAQEGWRLIGTTQAKFTADNDGIVVKAPYNNFQHIKIKVTGATLRLIKLVITFDSGAPDNIEMIVNIPAGGESSVIDLRGVEGRKIKRIDFWYDTQDNTQAKANVSIFGSD
jgi:hypothetical protein